MTEYKTYLGIDLSGPSNTKDTVAVSFVPDGDGLKCSNVLVGADDSAILCLADRLSSRGTFAVGLDAPLSYNPGGGDRPADRELRRTLVSAGLKSGTIMPPTMTRMAYLSLRGISVARMLSTSFQDVFVAEVHPAGAMALRGAPVEDVRNLKTDENARQRLLQWITGLGIRGVDKAKRPSDHYVAACAAVLGIWQLARGKPSWHYPSATPFHPFDYAC